jgi:hypothetical protein
MQLQQSPHLSGYKECCFITKEKCKREIEKKLHSRLWSENEGFQVRPPKLKEKQLQLVNSPSLV